MCYPTRFPQINVFCLQCSAIFETSNDGFVTDLNIYSQKVKTLTLKNILVYLTFFKF